MKTRKITALLAAFVMTAGLTGNMYAGAETNAGNDGADFSVERSYIYSWPGDDGSYAVLSGEITSDDSIFAIKPVYDDKKVKVITKLSSESTEYLVLPEGCMTTEYDAFLDCKSLKAVSVPDSVNDISVLDKNVAIVGNKGTYAEFFARRNENEFILSGDTDLDGKVGAADIVGEMLYLTGQEDFESDISKLAADINKDGKINIIDLIRMKKSAVSGSYDDILGDDILAAPAYDNLYTNADQDDISTYIDFVSGFTDNVLLNTDDEKGGSNRIYSPLSIYMAVSVLADCTENESLEEFKELLCFSDKEELRKNNHDMFGSLYFDEFSRYCRMTNSIWLDRSFTFKEDMLKNLAENYYTASFVRDFSSQPDCNEISDWIYQNTSGKFSPFIKADEPNEKTMLKIINTVTFREKWAKHFYGSKEGTFHGSDGDVNCMFMHGEDLNGHIYEDEDFTTYTKNFYDGYKMKFVLPAEGKSVNDIISDSEVMKRVLTSGFGEDKNVIADIPKFSSESKFDLISTLMDAGVSKAFTDIDIAPLIDLEDNGVDTAGISEIVHEAVIDVNEDGCEAAAYTMISLTPTTCAPENYEFTADRPFFYYITNSAGTPVFVGIVNDPTQK